jgi:hypothetical protein
MHSTTLNREGWRPGGESSPDRDALVYCKPLRSPVYFRMAGGRPSPTPARGQLIARLRATCGGLKPHGRAMRTARPSRPCGPLRFVLPRRVTQPAPLPEDEAHRPFPRRRRAPLRPRRVGLGTRTRMSQEGGQGAYRGRLGKVRNLGESPHSIASTK